MTDEELEQLCRSVVEDEENHFAVTLYRRGKTGLPRLITRVMLQIPKAEYTNDTLVKIHDTLRKVLGSTGN